MATRCSVPDSGMSACGCWVLAEPISRCGVNKAITHISPGTTYSKQADPDVGWPGEMEGIGPIDPDPEANASDRYRAVTSYWPIPGSLSIRSPSSEPRTTLGNVQANGPGTRVVVSCAEGNLRGNPGSSRRGVAFCASPAVPASTPACEPSCGSAAASRVSHPTMRLRGRRLCPASAPATAGALRASGSAKAWWQDVPTIVGEM
jgi:hypothetical protein